MKATAVIPARGGSVGVPRKNLRTVGGVPLVVRSVRAALAADSVNFVVVSTDDPEIAAVARRAGAEVHDRPEHLCGPDTTVAEVVADVADAYSLDGPVVVLQPTSPFTDGVLIDAVVDTMYAQGADSAETVTAYRHALFSPDGGTLNTEEVNRQTAPVTAWVPTGAVRAMLEFPASGGPLGGWPMVGETHVLFDPPVDLACTPEQAEWYAVDVDTPADFAVARDLASRGRITFLVTAGTDTGSGHLHRCLTLADELAQHDVAFDFLGEQAEWAIDMIRDRGYRLRHASPGQGHGGPPDVVVVDCLEGVSASVVLAMRSSGSRVVVLECLDADVVAAADLAVNSLYTGPPGALCGPMWEPLRPEFSTADEGVWTQAEVDAIADRVEDMKAGDPRRGRVLVSFGGTDPSDLTEWVTEVVADASQHDEIMVLWPPGKPMDGGTPVLGRPNVGVWTGAVSDALAWADVAVTSGGRTVLEAAAMSCPTIAVSAHEREEHHAPVPGVMWLGYHAPLSGDGLSRAVRWLLDHPAERKARGDRMRGAVDPAGAAVRLGQMIDGLVRR